MPDKLRNIIEDIARDFLNSALTLRYDICTCHICKNDMLAYVLSHVPAKYVTTEQGAMHTIMQQTRAEHQSEITRAIVKAIDIVSSAPRHKLREDKQQIFSLLLEKIHEDRNIDFRHYHQDLLRRRVAVRIRTLNLPNYSEYLRYLVTTPDEYDRLFEVLCINVSEFLRDSEVWTALGKIFESVMRKKKLSQEYTIKIWSAGCANGEEPYTIAILLKELLGSNISVFKLDIIATDVDKKAMDTAKEGAYEKQSIKSLDKNLIDKYFELESGIYRIVPEIKKFVTVKYLDLTTSDTVTDCDFVFCRNVFIYFDRSLQEQILLKFARALKTGGHMIMGKSETLIREVGSSFEPIDIENRIYRKNG